MALAAATTVLTAVAILIALFALIGYRQVRRAAITAAKKTAKEQFAIFVDSPEFEDKLVERSGPILGSDIDELASRLQVSRTAIRIRLGPEPFASARLSTMKKGPARAPSTLVGSGLA